ncbi:MAG TPA: UDP binding domain-containing protein, partial [bacterium]|nr:UDP binding domain-containing protein [bacterium]
QIAQAASTVNSQQRERMLEKIGAAVGKVKGSTVAMLGLSFKPNTNDLREAPALAIAQALMQEGASLRGYDPAALEEAAQALTGMIPCKDPYDAATGADALVLMTEWNEFRNLDFAKLKTLMRKPVLINLRNVYESNRVTSFGFHHISVGRAPKDPAAQAHNG